MKKLSVILVVLLSTSLFSQTISLRDISNQYDYIVITVCDFKQACLPFKEHKENFSGLQTVIVHTDLILQEFNKIPEDNSSKITQVDR